MRLFILYLFTLILFWVIYLLNNFFVFEWLFPELNQQDLDEVAASPEQLKELVPYLFYTLLYALAFISFAVLPAVVAQSVCVCVERGLFMSMVVWVGAELVNFKHMMHRGVKLTVYSLVSTLVTVVIVACTSYYIGRLLLV